MRSRMRTALLVAAALAATTPAYADTPRAVRGETIVIQDQAPPWVAPKPTKRYHRIAPPYSDRAILTNTWAKAWLLLDIDAAGSVTRVKLLNKPGSDLDQIAIDYAFTLKFAPAQDARGNPTRSQLVWPIEWPSYWYMVELEGVATRIPDGAARVRCRGSGPMAMGSLHPTYRDCSRPDLTKIQTAAWVTK
jgi:hypothetical protein